MKIQGRVIGVSTSAPPHADLAFLNVHPHVGDVGIAKAIAPSVNHEGYPGGVRGVVREPDVDVSDDSTLRPCRQTRRHQVFEQYCGGVWAAEVVDDEVFKRCANQGARPDSVVHIAAWALEGESPEYARFLNGVGLHLPDDGISTSRVFQ